MRKLWVSIVIAISLIAAGTAVAGATLSIGNSAPAIKVGKWVKGPAISKLDPAKIYVIEFWATWCGPCKQSIPHLTDLAKKYKGKVTFAGVSVWEHGDVPAFVKSMGAKMNYSVATDNSAGFMAKSWMAAAGENGIPTAFVVGKKGKILWIGHPMGDLDAVLGMVLSGKFNAAVYGKQRAKDKAADDKRTKMMDEVSALADQGKAKEALAKLDNYLAEDPSFETDAIPIKIHLLFLTDEKAGYDYVRKQAAGTLKDNPYFLSFLASSIIDQENKIKSPDYELAASLAQQAIQLSKEESANILYKASYIYEAKGDIPKAIDCEDKAVKAAAKDKNTSPQVMGMVKSRLDELKAKQK
jgi:thiol-disulfide isomerase/thioredoxin